MILVGRTVGFVGLRSLLGDVRVAQFPVLVDEIIAGELASADLARIILNVQVQQPNLPPVSSGVVLPLSVPDRVGRHPGRQQVPLGVLPVTVLRLERVPAVTAGVAPVAVVRVHPRLDLLAPWISDSRRSAVLVVLAGRGEIPRLETRPLETRLCGRGAGSARRGRRRRVILVQHSMKLHRAIAASYVVNH